MFLYFVIRKLDEIVNIKAAENKPCLYPCNNTMLWHIWYLSQVNKSFVF